VGAADPEGIDKCGFLKICHEFFRRYAGLTKDTSKRADRQRLPMHWDNTNLITLSSLLSEYDMASTLAHLLEA
jgi:hypothetical protein